MRTKAERNLILAAKSFEDLCFDEIHPGEEEKLIFVEDVSATLVGLCGFGETLGETIFKGRDRNVSKLLAFLDRILKEPIKIVAFLYQLKETMVKK